MASRAHGHDYYGNFPERARRVVRYPGRNDPIALPRDTSSNTSTILIASALVATATIVGGAYAVYAGTPPPPLAETPSLELVPTYELDDEPLKTQMVELLGGPARAVPSVAITTEEPAEDAYQPETFTAPAEPAITPTPRRTAPEPLPTPTTPDAPPREQPYPNPTTTPPDAVAPPSTNPELPLPLLDPENPYR